MSTYIISVARVVSHTDTQQFYVRAPSKEEALHGLTEMLTNPGYYPRYPPPADIHKVQGFARASSTFSGVYEKRFEVNMPLDSGPPAATWDGRIVSPMDIGYSASMTSYIPQSEWVDIVREWIEELYQNSMFILHWRAVQTHLEDILRAKENTTQLMLACPDTRTIEALADYWNHLDAAHIALSSI